ncbi:MAG: hypothetical protein ABI411_01515 [Tahibacter sp.]
MDRSLLCFKLIKTATFAMHPFLRQSLLLAALCAAAVSTRAEKLEPPSEVLHSPLVNVTATEFVEVAAFGHVVFRRIKTLSGRDDALELIDLIVPEELVHVLKPGSRQLIAWSAIGSDPLVPEGMRRDPAGARLVVTTGLEPALFADTRENRALVRWDLGESAWQQRRQLPRLLKLLDTPEAAVQTFAIAEIALRPSVVAALDDAARDRLRAFAIEPRAPENARALLLELVAQRAVELGEKGWSEVAEHILSQTPVTASTAPGHESLVRQAFAVAESRAATLSGESVERWLRSDSTALAETALLTLRRTAPEREPLALEAALSRSDLPAPTRSFLLDHQRRLRLMSTSSH